MLINKTCVFLYYNSTCLFPFHDGFSFDDQRKSSPKYYYGILNFLFSTFLRLKIVSSASGIIKVMPYLMRA